MSICSCPSKRRISGRSTSFAWCEHSSHEDIVIGIAVVSEIGSSATNGSSLTWVETSAVTLSSYFLSGSHGSGVELPVAMIIEVGELTRATIFRSMVSQGNINDRVVALVTQINPHKSVTLVELSFSSDPLW